MAEGHDRRVDAVLEHRLVLDQVLCEEGERGQEFLVLVDEEVEVTRRGRRVATGRGGDFFGEISVVERMPRTEHRHRQVANCASLCSPDKRFAQCSSAT